MHLENCIPFYPSRRGTYMSRITNIRKRKDGYWEGRYTKDGKRRSVFGKTRNEAQTKLEEKLAKAAQDICVE